MRREWARLPPSANFTEEEKEKPESANDRHEATEAHYDESRELAGAAHVLLGGVGFAPEAVGATDREAEREHRLAETEDRQLPARCTPDRGGQRNA